MDGGKYYNDSKSSKHKRNAVAMAGVCVRFSSFNLESLNLARFYRVAKEQAGRKPCRGLPVSD